MAGQAQGGGKFRPEPAKPVRHDIAYALIALMGIAPDFASLHLRRRRIRHRKAMRGGRER